MDRSLTVAARLRRFGAALAVLLSIGILPAAPKRVLYVTHSAGFRHDSIPTSRAVLESLATRTGALEIVSTEDLSRISAESLRDFDVVFFFTSGELPLSDAQKAALLAFVRDGKGFGGVHSATDTLYNWPEYGDLIGGYFDGHPWAQEVAIDVEDPDHPSMSHLAPSFRIADEIYQFRNFSRERVRVLMTLDTRSVDLKAPGVNRADGDFALAWCRDYGKGRVFYTALGHGDETWRDDRFQQMVWNALRWLAGDVSADAAPRPPLLPAITPRGVVNAASFSGDAVAPGSLVSIFGTNLTSGSTMQARSTPLPVRLAGTSVLVNGSPIPLLYAAPGQINAQLPFGIDAAEIVVRSVTRESARERVAVEAGAPGLFAVVAAGRELTIYATGLGAVRPPVATGAEAPLAPLSETVATPVVTVAGRPATVRFSGLAPRFVGLYQVNAIVPADTAPGRVAVVLQIGERRSNSVLADLTL